MAGDEIVRARLQAVEKLQERLGHVFTDPGLLRTALTHRSYANEQGIGEHYERMELLGDAVLGLVVTAWLYRKLPDTAEGELSRLRSFLVSEPLLATQARELGLGEVLLLGVGEDRSGGRRRKSLLADVFESVLGAVYLDGGFEAARSVLRPLLDEALSSPDAVEFSDPKTELQEIVQARGNGLPEYRHVAEEGPDHRKRFLVECRLDGEVSGRGQGRTKKEAEQQAARQALEAVRSDTGSDSAPEREVKR